MSQFQLTPRIQLHSFIQIRIECPFNIKVGVKYRFSYLKVGECYICRFFDCRSAASAAFKNLESGFVPVELLPETCLRTIGGTDATASHSLGWGLGYGFKLRSVSRLLWVGWVQHGSGMDTAWDGSLPVFLGLSTMDTRMHA